MMRYGRNVLVLLPVLLACAPGRPALGNELRVTGDNVNMRARPSLEYEVVMQVNAGDELTEIAREDGWVGVRAPEGAYVWIGSEYVGEGRVKAARLNMRSGPGINYTVMGQLGRGDAVDPVETFGEWVKIRAPQEVTFWIHEDFIEAVRPDPPSRPEPIVQPAPGPGQRDWVSMPAQGSLSVATDTAGPAGDRAATAASEEDLPYPAPEDMKLVPLSGQGREASYTGILAPVRYLIGRPSRFELVSEAGDGGRRECYVRGNIEQLSGMVGRRMRITGKEYWAQDVDHPIVVPEKITLDPAPRRSGGS